MSRTFDHMMLNQHGLQTAMHLEDDDSRLLMQLYGMRVAALVAATCLWVGVTLISGVMTVAMVVLVGAMVGNAHHLLGNVPRWTHYGSVLLLTLLGGFVANVLAGLALFSSTMGVSYWQVLTSRRIPEDMPMLVNLFVESSRPADGLFYALAVAVAMLSLRHLQPLRMQLEKA
jgi:hypothetical protein